MRHGLLDRVAGALLRLLQREAQIVLSGEGLLDAVGAMTEQMGAAAQSASKAWWDLLQQQFNQIAAATAASMPGGSPAPDAGAAPKASPGGPQAAAKPAAKAAKATGQTAARKTARKPAAKPAAKNTGPADGKP